MLLEHLKERRDITADIIDHLDLGPGRPAQEDSAHTDKRLRIGVVGRALDDGAYAPGKIAFAALIAGGRGNWGYCA